MPELPEVTTTVMGLQEVLPSLIIRDVWTDYFVRSKHKRKDTIKNEDYFTYFKKEIVGEKVKSSERRGKNILIHLTHNKTILIHMKMTGHLLFGKYVFDGEKWKSAEKLMSHPLRDPFNGFIHLAFTFGRKKHLVFSDMRKFAKVFVFPTNTREELADLKDLGPEPLDGLTFETFVKRLQTKPKGKIKTTLMDQTIIAGIGNIYSDEILWEAGIHPERRIEKIKKAEMKSMLDASIKILTTGIALGGDSMSDYRNIHGERGKFQNSHKAYRRTKEKCFRAGCKGFILRKIVGGRSAHFCSLHQK